MPNTKLDKSPPWSDWREFAGKLEAGYFYANDLAATREYLYDKLCVIPKVAVTHKTELRKLSIVVGKERMVIQREPEHAEDIARFCEKFGLEYRGASLCSAVGNVMEKLLRPKRQAFSDARRDAVYELSLIHI